MSQKVFNGNNIELLKEYPDNYFDAIVTDPPYGLGKEPNAEQMLQAWITDGYLEVKGSGFMGKEWDAFVPQPIFWKEVFRVLKPGGHILSFFGTRTYDWGVMAMRLAGFEVRDCINWVYGSGFPKSHNIGKNIEKIKVGGIKNLKKVGEKKGIKVETGTQGFSYSKEYVAGKSMGGKQISGNIPIYEITNEWEGWGSALKPAHEDIVLARKPLEKGLSIAENVLKWGTGGINIDGCRVGLNENDDKRLGGNGSWKTDKTARNVYEGGYEGKEIQSSSLGRFPANLILSHSNYQVMNLVGNIDYLILVEIIRYFYGYTKVSDLRQRKRSSTKQDKCGDGNGSIKEREPILEVLDFDIPAEWLQYFEYTGEQLGCVCVGTKKVGNGKEGGYNYKGNNYQVEGFVTNNSPEANSNYGEETIENWNCHEDCPIRIMDEQSGITKTGDIKPYFQKNIDSYSGSMPEIREVNFKGDKGGASRFFYCAKASKKERNKGLDQFETKQTIGGGGTYNEEAGAKYGSIKAPNQNFHPTVKPISLMRYLVRLITPANGIVLDPFNGSGTTGIACKLEGMNYVGMELDAEYCKIAQARIDNFTESDLEYEVEELNEDAQTNESEQKDNEDDNLDTQLSLF